MKRKFNGIDLLVIVVMIIIAVGAYKYLTKDDSGQTIVTGKETITFIAEAYKLSPEICDNIAPDDQIVAVGQYQDAYIKEVYVEDTVVEAVKDNEIIMVNDPTTKTLRVLIEAKVNRYGSYMDFGGQRIKAGDSYWIKTDQMAVYGYVVKVVDQE
ncbi:MAG: hypothetical protein CVV02_17460 [Firmicutes bacterium HGW-Firmicutes-7]|nr:MAG: hypothetical protein CVV02_17460 [Firmicutes bacterium HGW-Firmicutes-7]